jgi:FtsH-binding integral membrane protein
MDRSYDDSMTDGARSALGSDGRMPVRGRDRFIAQVYALMSLGLGTSALTAFVAYSTGFYERIVHGPLFWVVLLAPVALVILLGAVIDRLSLAAAHLAFWLYAVLMGVSLAGIFVIYTGGSLFQTFLAAAAVFAGMSFYGRTTRRDLSSLGAFLMMGLLGIIIAGLVNLFLGSPALDFAVSAIGVVIFTGLTAYDTQKLERLYAASDPARSGKAAILGALTLYLDLINLFLVLLRFLGRRKR